MQPLTPPQQHRVADYLPLLNREIRRRWVVGRAAVLGLTEDDLRQEASLALMAAAAGFEAGHGASFATYAGTAIRNRLWGLLSASRVAWALRVESLDQDAGRHTRTHVREPDFDLATRVRQPREATDEGAAPDAHADAHTLRAALDRLPPDRRALLVAHYGLEGEAPALLSEIAAERGLKRQTTSLHHCDALRRLRALLAEEEDDAP